MLNQNLSLVFGCVMQVNAGVSFFLQILFVTCTPKCKYMDREFKSKVDWWYHGLIFIMAFITVLSFVAGGAVLIMITSLLITMMLIHKLLTTWYRITADGYLVVHCSIFPEKRIKVEEISAIEATAMPVSSYALSLDRMVIYKGNLQWLLISPKDKKEFLRCLRKFNPDIEVKDSSII